MRNFLFFSFCSFSYAGQLGEITSKMLLLNSSGEIFIIISCCFQTAYVTCGDSRQNVVYRTACNNPRDFHISFSCRRNKGKIAGADTSDVTRLGPRLYVCV